MPEQPPSSGEHGGLPDLLVPVVGTLGDLLPALAVGRAMAQQGYRPTFIANPFFADRIAQAGFALVPIGKATEFREMVEDADFWRTDKAAMTFLKRGIIPSYLPVYRAILEIARSRRVVVAAMNYAFGALAAARTDDIPTAHLVIQPAMLNPPAPNGDKPSPEKFGYLLGAAETYMKLTFRMLAGRPRQIPTIGLFPHWLVDPSLALPDSTILTGFPLYDATLPSPISPALRKFLDTGAPPVVIFAGSNRPHHGTIFASAVAACRSLSRRAVLVTASHLELSGLCDHNVIAVPYASFSALLPRAAAFIHHGGIGTIASGLAAGRPQLAITSNFETPENAELLTRLGVGAALSSTKASPGHIAHALGTLAASPSVNRRCAEAAMLMRTDNPFEKVCDVLCRLTA